LATQFAELLRAHSAWAAPVCFLLAFAESLAFVSLFVPSTIILIAAGALIGASGLSFWEVWIGASLGAAAGDWLSYALGKRFGPSLAEVWPLSRYPALLSRGQSFFERWGAFGVFIGRFFGPLRASIPLVAGICAMPLIAFQAANLSSAFVWAFVILAPGVFGAQWLPQWFG
jgi:membrane protein DedA with SNARE-associated domain